ncbi:IS21 family transposase [Chitinophaga sp. LS1]|uniref:IS21 family transposase n=1 Tax=Chitinophaga sp. LS1 TaxID=3051176 RepID=UPI002AABF2E6|nr:IS21 family transposase [Chitinophaga sp. LS1]WPV64297.1 IS21 family transposase [Chitinophaga sp. LS1]WPV66703.1 IS21 family transposase [Chitinophaga sp. LS1]WPV68262.1 IS21 family transposase [Chitinophaga sp. LS1]
MMNAYLKKIMMYQSIKELHEQGFSIAKISSTIGINWRTVKSYLSMTLEEYNLFIEKRAQRQRGLSVYESFVREKLEKYQDTSSAQMHDWLKENFPEFPKTAIRTMFDFVMWVRRKYNLPYIKPLREYEMLEESPYGKQAQADFGEYNLRNGTGKRVKIYFIAIQLSRSRYKYIWFIGRPFTTELAIMGHEQAFSFFKGIPEQLVYDQDKVFIADENIGDILLTDAFRAYTRERPFELHFCRKSDPESKGKIESVVKYVKRNFLYNRCFIDIENLNEEALQWLNRTGNNMPHGTTKLLPNEEWLKEQPYLSALPEFIQTTSPEIYMVRKDNTISYKSNFYSLPLGTFKGKGTAVVVGVDMHIYLIISNLQGDILCKHMIAVGKGQKVLNTDHRRDKTVKIDKLINEVCGFLEDDANRGRQFLETIREVKPRYIRDQVLLFRDTIDISDKVSVGEALTYCLNNNIQSANDFKSIVEQQLKVRRATSILNYQSIQMNPLNGELPPVALAEPAKSSIEDYIDLFSKQS